LGIALLTGQDASFEQVYGDLADQISFEYRLFHQHLGQGFRVDLCGWEWKKKPTVMLPGSSRTSQIQAQRGWQGTTIMTEPGAKYSFTATGTWQTSGEGLPTDANGDSAGAGKLVGILFDDFKLSEPFELGTSGAWEAPAKGHLFVRCQDDWCKLADNKGKV